MQSNIDHLTGDNQLGATNRVHVLQFLGASGGNTDIKSEVDSRLGSRASLPV